MAKNSSRSAKRASQPLAKASRSEASARTDDEAAGENRVAPPELQPRSTPPARRSTGPRTAAGKKRSRYNATKHGILSNVALLPNESRSEFDSLLSGLQKGLKPEGALENVLVEKLATLFWRYRRLLVAEGAEIQKATAFLNSDEQERQEKEALQTIEPRLQKNMSEMVGLIERVHNPEVLEECLRLLKTLRFSIQSAEFDPATERLILATVYGNQKHFARTLFDTYEDFSDAAKLPDEQSSQALQKYRRGFLAALDEELEYLRRRQDERALVNSEKMRLEALRQNVPDSQDRLLRHEASLERAIDRTLTQLERLQRMRLGQPVSSPIKVSVSS